MNDWEIERGSQMGVRSPIDPADSGIDPPSPDLNFTADNDFAIEAAFRAGQLEGHERGLSEGIANCRQSALFGVIAVVAVAVMGILSLWAYRTHSKYKRQVEEASQLKDALIDANHEKNILKHRERLYMDSNLYNDSMNSKATTQSSVSFRPIWPPIDRQSRKKTRAQEPLLPSSIEHTDAFLAGAQQNSRDYDAAIESAEDAARLQRMLSAHTSLVFAGDAPVHDFAEPLVVRPNRDSVDYEQGFLSSKLSIASVEELGDINAQLYGSSSSSDYKDALKAFEIKGEQNARIQSAAGYQHTATFGTPIASELHNDAVERSPQAIQDLRVSPRVRRM